MKFWRIVLFLVGISALSVCMLFAFAFVIGLGQAAGVLPTSTPKPTATATLTPSVTPTPSITPTPSQTPLPTNTPLPTRTLTPEESLERRLLQAIGESNRDSDERVSVEIDRFDIVILHIEWDINDNLTENMITQGAKLDIKEMLQALVQGNVEFGLVNFTGSFPMVDNFGNASEMDVVKVSYTKETVDKINFPRFLHDDVYSIADTVNNHPLFGD